MTIKAITSELEMHGCLVMSSGIVKSNTRRKLDLEEFRGFAIADEIAPLVFINANDSKAGRIFSLIHEFGHVLLGKSGISDSSSNDVPQDSASHSQDELWCNALAAEFLVPESYIKVQFQKGISPRRVNEVARITKASTLVVIKQLFKVGLIGWDEYEELYTTELKHLQANLANAAKKSGGDYYRTQVSRLSRNFVRAVISDTLSGRTLHRDAYDLLGTKKSATFEKLASSVGLA